MNKTDKEWLKIILVVWLLAAQLALFDWAEDHQPQEIEVNYKRIDQ